MRKHWHGERGTGGSPIACRRSRTGRTAPWTSTTPRTPSGAPGRGSTAAARVTCTMHPTGNAQRLLPTETTRTCSKLWSGPDWVSPSTVVGHCMSVTPQKAHIPTLHAACQARTRHHNQLADRTLQPTKQKRCPIADTVQCVHTQTQLFGGEQREQRMPQSSTVLRPLHGHGRGAVSRAGPPVANNPSLQRQKRAVLEYDKGQLPRRPSPWRRQGERPYPLRHGSAVHARNSFHARALRQTATLSADVMFSVARSATPERVHDYGDDYGGRFRESPPRQP